MDDDYKQAAKDRIAILLAKRLDNDVKQRQIEAMQKAARDSSTQTRVLCERLYDAGARIGSEE